MLFTILNESSHDLKFLRSSIEDLLTPYGVSNQSLFRTFRTYNDSVRATIFETDLDLLPVNEISELLNGSLEENNLKDTLHINVDFKLYDLVEEPFEYKI